MKVKKHQTRTTRTGNDLRENIAIQELNLNIKHQIKKIKEFTQIGYEFEKGYFVFMLLIPILKLK